jgi:hypothetical protein
MRLVPIMLDNHREHVYEVSIYYMQKLNHRDAYTDKWVTALAYSRAKDVSIIEQFKNLQHSLNKWIKKQQHFNYDKRLCQSNKEINECLFCIMISFFKWNYARFFSVKLSWMNTIFNGFTIIIVIYQSLIDSKSCLK